jgi:hypothetical protein
MTRDELIDEIKRLGEKFKEMGGEYMDQTMINTKGQSVKRLIIEYHNEID